MTVKLYREDIEKILLEYVIDKCSSVTRAYSKEDLEWNDYSLIVPAEGLEFSRKKSKPDIQPE